MVVLVGDAGVPVTNSEHAVCQLRYRARGRALRRPRCWDQPGVCSRRQGSRDTRHHHRHRTCPSRWVLGSRLQCGPHLRRLSRGHEWGCPLVTSLPGSVPRSGPHGAPSCRLLGHLGMGGGLMLPTEAEQDPTTGGPGAGGGGGGSPGSWPGHCTGPTRSPVALAGEMPRLCPSSEQTRCRRQMLPELSARLHSEGARLLAQLLSHLWALRPWRQEPFEN